jgi:hypothetical protein
VASSASQSAAGPTPPVNDSALIVGRPLVRGRWAVLFLNNAATAVNMTCARNCFAAAGFKVPPVGAEINDVWGGRIGVVGANGFSVVVPPDGASRFVVLTPL